MEQSTVDEIFTMLETWLRQYARNIFLLFLVAKKIQGEILQTLSLLITLE
jgi:hypothetical protein